MDLYEWLNEEAKTHFVDSYIEGCDSDKIAAETLGVKIAKICRWDGEKIAHFLIRALYSGLEDANWHTEAGVFYDWDDRMEKGESIGQILHEEIVGHEGAKLWFVAEDKNDGN